ncbi:MAG TPA: MFS transporter [Gammaproteobacteria bacterium]|jgi:predicted MFS family arabinose efflux permease|nr:MFS transporter [Gammaproteobacteria bacterium]
MAEQGATVRAAKGLLVASVYLNGFLQGLILVSFPASSTVLKAMHGFTDTQYGTIFLPQVALAVLGSVGGGVLARRLGLKALLWSSLLISGTSQLLLTVTIWFTPSLAFAGILLGTACLGLGFGLSGAPLNSYPPRFFPARRDTAVVALHTALGLGLAAGPLLAGWTIANHAWIAFPLSLLVVSLLLTAMVIWLKWPDMDEALRSDDTAHMAAAAGIVEGERPIVSASFWIFFAIAVLYAFAEGTFYNWAVIYLQDSKMLPMEVAAASLSVFWAAMVVGRLAASVAVLRLPAEWIWLAFPVLMICAFLALPYATTPALGIGLFALSGLACSAFFPLTVGLISKRFDRHVAWVSSMMIAALMFGNGIGSFVIGLLRKQLALEQLYRFSSLYPLLVLILAMVLLRQARKPHAPSIESVST